MYIYIYIYNIYIYIYTYIYIYMYWFNDSRILPNLLPSKMQDTFCHYKVS